MATKNLRKVKNWGLGPWGFTDDFNPKKYPVTWVKFEKYVDRAEKIVLFNELFRPLYKEMLREELGAYYKGGHKLSAALKKEIKSDVKARAKEIVKAKLAAKAAAKPSYKEQEDVLPEG